MFPSAYLALCLLQVPGEGELQGTPASETLQVKVDEAGMALAWSDVEDRIQGTLEPTVPRAGEPLKVSVHVGTFQGPEFEGPVSFTLRPLVRSELKEGEPLGLKPLQDTSGGQGGTVTRGRGERAWAYTFHPADEGKQVLEISFRTTRLKVVRGVVEIETAKLPRWPWYVLALGAVLGSVGFGLWTLFRRETPPPPVEGPTP